MQKWLRRSLALLFGALTVVPGAAQSYLGEGVAQSARRHLLLPDGSEIIVGKIRKDSTSDLDLAIWRLDACGFLLAEDHYGGSRQDEALAIAATRDGGYIVAGYSFTAETGYGRHDLYLLKFTADHQLAWERRQGRPWREIPFAIRETDAGYGLVGYTKSQGLHGDVYFARLSPTGEVLNDHYYESDFVDLGFDFQPTPEGFLLLATESGFYFPSQANHHHPDADILLIRTDSLGRELERRPYGGPRHDFARQLVPAGDGGWYIIGSSQNASSGSFDVLLMRLDVNLEVLWERRYGGSSFDYGEAMRKVGSDLWLVGTGCMPDGQAAAYLIRTDGQGTPLFECHIRGNAPTYGQDISLAASETISCIGYTRSGPSGQAIRFALSPQLFPIAPCPSPRIPLLRAPFQQFSASFPPEFKVWKTDGEPIQASSLSQLAAGTYHFSGGEGKITRFSGTFTIY